MKRWIGIFLCLLSLHSARSMAREAEPVRFSVLTYNVSSQNPEKLRQNLPLIGAKLDAFDIAGIQGCFASCELLLNAAHHPNKYYFQQRPHPWNRFNSGLASLSNFPLVEVKKLYYRAQSALTNENATKGILLMRYDINGHILDVYNTHMQNGAEDIEQTARVFQTAELVQYIYSESPADHLVILHGDFDWGVERPAVMAKLKLHEPRLRPGTESVLYRSGSNTVFKPISWQDMSEVFSDAEGRPLSDDAPFAVQFEME